MKEIKILGAGPAGLSAAITLRKAGYQVNVYEKNEDVGKRFNGDLEGLENWSSKIDILELFKKLNIEINFNYDPFSKFIISNGVKNVEFSLDKPAFYLIKRGSIPGSLDQSLKGQAENLGVSIHFNETKKDVDIIATGPIPDKIVAIAKGIKFRTTSNDVSIVLLNNEAAYNGYAYLLITKGYGCMVSVVFNKLEKIKHCSQKTKQIFSELIDLDIKRPEPVGGIGCFTNRNTFKENGKLYVGEAAGLQDFLWEYGIKKAIVSGYLAATSIINNRDYGKVVKQYFDNEIKSGVVNRFLWDLFGVNNYSVILNKLETSKNILETLNSFHNFNRIQRLLYPTALIYSKLIYKNL